MIVVEDGDRLRLVTQCDHAHLAADLLALWRPLAGVDGREVLLRATRCHDDGWQRVDAAPPVDDAGRPHDFLSLPWSLRFEVWDRGTAAFAAEPEVALLIAEHALALLGGPSPGDEPEEADPPARRLVELVETRRQTLLETLGPRAAAVLALYPWLRAADLLSLAITNRWQGRELECALPGQERPLRAMLLDGALLLDPFPYVGATTFRYAERRVESRPYRDRVDLGGSLAAAPWISQRVSIRSRLPGR
ncbi:MAG TPA: DUF3891 family protein [Thermoanaerobaculia bacterium]|nr:DUF3891 family protein [Thermoanaerobaculia bacterium]